MNEKIKQLLAQAHLEVEDIKDTNKIAEKFADLIIQECSEVIQDFVDHRFPASEYPKRLKNYFGIEK